MSEIKYIVGIDFGHGQTSANIIEVGNDEVRELPIVGRSAIIDSVMCSNNGDWELGTNIDRIKHIIEDIEEGNSLDFRSYFKVPVFLEGESKDNRYNYNRKSFGDFIKEVHKQIIENSNNRYFNLIDGKDGNFLLFVACPSGWDEKQKNAFHDFIKNELHIPCQDVVKESNAAWINYRPKRVKKQEKTNLLVIDYGSSTIDFTWVNPKKNIETIHYGVDCGASRVEEALYEYIKDSDLAKAAESELIKTLYPNNKGDRDMIKGNVKKLITYCLRKKKEDFYDEIDRTRKEEDKENVVFESLNIIEIVGPGVSGEFVLDDRQINKKLFDEIIKGYKDEVENHLKYFRAKYMENSKPAKIKLTGGAARMDFIAPMISKVYDCEIGGFNDYYFDVSKGITKYGALIHNSESARLELNNILNTWGNPDWVKNQINDEVIPLVRDTLKKEILVIFHKWQNGEIKLDKSRSIKEEWIDEILENANNDYATCRTEFKNRWSEFQDAKFIKDFLDSEGEENEDDEEELELDEEESFENEEEALDEEESLETYYNQILDDIRLKLAEYKKKCKMWKKVKGGWGYDSNGRVSIHSLLSEIMNYIEDEDKDFSNIINEELKTELKNDSQEILLNYVKKYFEEETNEFISDIIEMDMRKINYSINITKEMKLNLLCNMVEKTHDVIFNSKIDLIKFSWRSFIKERFEKERKVQFAPLADAFEPFVNSITVEFEEGNKTGKEVANQIRLKIQKIQEICENAVK